MGKMKKQRIKVELVESSSLAEWPCHVCGRMRDKAPILAEVRKGEFKGFRVCGTCIKKRNFDQKLLEHAGRLEKFGQKLRALIGRLDVPTFKEYRAKVREYNKEWRKEHKEELRRMRLSKRK
jgi:hypothetical protein